MATARENAINLYMEGIRDGNARMAVEKYTGSRYTQHSTGVKDGVEGFVEFFEPFITRNPKRDIQIIRALQDDRHVFIHAFQSLNDGEAMWITTDFFDSDEKGLILEHWDVIGEFKGETPLDRVQIDGETKIVDLDKTEDNRRLVEAFIQTVLIGGHVEKTPDFINSEKYFQHNFEFKDGIESFQNAWSALNRALTYQENFMTVAEGNFVATLNRAKREGQDLCQVDLFRVEEGKIVEHWDNSESVPPKEEWANSGKF